ncbi:pantoate--beta-alanine ligase [Microvirga sp. VF16]|uniref:pantoate--beta-alanine ligase n=1 Tax=Microvirga sp. VF16 TaxID=2807101 RepID=UPI0035301BBA
MTVAIVTVPTVHEADRLALSSRNRFLSLAEREGGRGWWWPRPPAAGRDSLEPHDRGRSAAVPRGAGGRDA